MSVAPQHEPSQQEALVMKRDSRKPQARPANRLFPAWRAALDGIGSGLVEAIVGLWLGLALAALAAWIATPEFQRGLSVEILLGTPDHLCQPRIGGGPYLDGDGVTLA